MSLLNTSPTLSFLASNLRAHKLLLLGTIGFSLASALSEGLSMAFLALTLQVMVGGEAPDLGRSFGRLGETIDSWHSIAGQEKMFAALLLATVLFQVLRAALRFAADASAGWIQAKIEARIQRLLIDDFLTSSLSSIKETRTGDLASYGGQVQFVGRLINRAGAVTAEVLLVVAYFFLLLWLSWPATLVAIVGAAVILGAAAPIVRKIRKSANRFKDAMVELSEQTVELLQGLRVIKSFGRETYASERAALAIHEAESATKWGVLWQSSLSPLVNSLAVFGISIALAYGYLRIGFDDPSLLGRFAAFIIVLTRALPRFSTINKTYGLVNHYYPFATRVGEFLDRPRTAGKRSSAVRPAPELSQRLELDMVGLCYPGRETWALQEISLTLEAGNSLAIVGESGSGKSSLIDLILGLIEPSAGRILIDGVDLETLDLGSWRERLAVVSQEVFLFHDTVLDNLRFACPGAGTNEIVKAAELAQAHDFISALPKGYDTLLGDRGHSLSGGQRQRLAVARALLRKPQLLLLDEAASALDSATAATIMESIEASGLIRTAIIVSHRIPSVRNVSEIIVLDRGRIVDRGSHSFLLSTSERYQALAAGS